MATHRNGRNEPADLLDCYVKATRLIIEMFEDPERTYGSGPALLQHCWEGYPVETLRPLLQSQHVHLQATAAFVASELGYAAAPVLDAAITLLTSSTTRIQADAMDVVAVCAADERYIALVQMLDHPVDVIRKQAEFLVGHATAAQRDVARGYFEGLGRPDDAKRWGSTPEADAPPAHR